MDDKQTPQPDKSSEKPCIRRGPVRFIREGKTRAGAWAHYTYKTNCGIMKVSVFSDDAGYPIRTKLEPASGAGCEASIETMSRLVTLLLECNVDLERFVLPQLEKVTCKSCQRAMGKASAEEGQEGVKKYVKSCAAGLAKVLRRFMEE